MQLLMKWFKQTDTQLIEDLKDFIDDFETRTDRRMTCLKTDLDPFTRDVQLIGGEERASQTSAS